VLTLSWIAISCGVPFEDEAAGAGVKPFVVFAHDDKVDVLRLLVLQRTETLVGKVSPGAD